MITSEPWTGKISLPWGRCAWVLLSLLFFPSIIFHFGIPEIYIPFLSTLIALPACFASSQTLGLKPLNRGDLSTVLIGYLAIVFLSLLVMPLWKNLLNTLPIDYAKQQDLLLLLPKCSRFQLIQLFIAVCLITPVVEETVFRRIIYGELVKINTVAAFILTSLAFSLMHFFILGIPGLFIMGIFFQLTYLCRQNLAAAILMHSVVNCIAFIAALIKG